MFKKPIFLLLIVCFIFFCGFFIIQLGSDIFSRKYYEVIPFESFSSNAMIIPVTIGDKTYNFQFDTGASTSISKELFSELNLAVVDSAESRDYYNNKKLVYQAVLPDLTIGKTRFSDIKVGVIRPIQSFTSFGMKIDGCLGNDVLSKGVVQIDMHKQQLVIANSIKSIDIANHNSVDFQVNVQMIPYLNIHFSGMDDTEEAMFDTGSANHYYRLEKSTFQKMVKNQLLKSKDILATLGPSANGSGVFGKQKEKEIFVVNFDSISFVGQTIYNCPAYTFTSGYSSVIGSPFLQLGVVTINYRDQKFYFKPYHDQLIDLGPKNGFKKRRKKEIQMAVQSVLKDSLAESKDIGKDYMPMKLHSVGLDSLSSSKRFKFEWPKEIDRDSVDYIFPTKEKGYLNVQINK